MSELIIKPKHLPGDDGYKIFSVRIKEDIVERIDAVSNKTGQSRNHLISIFIDYAMNNLKIE